MSDRSMSPVPTENCEREKGLSLTEDKLLYSKLQCMQCGKCLSVKPVSEIDGQYMCGRCCPQAKQCLLYAAVAEHFTFPCIFRDCVAELRWGNVKSHEKACFYRDVSCPFSECIDRYQFIFSQSHFKDSHALHDELFCSEDLNLEKLGASNSYYYDNLHCMLFRGITFLVFMKIRKQPCCGDIKGICQFSVFFISHKNDPSKQLFISNEENKLSNLECEIRINSDITALKSIDGNDVKEFIDTQHCLSCLYEFCNKPDHTNTGDTFLTDDLEFRTKSKSFSYTIKFFKKNCLIKLPSIECPICNNDFSEPIYLCPTGHSLCSNCYDNVDDCPFCREELSGSPIRNFSLEELVRECTSIDSK